MSATIQIVGDFILYDGQTVGTILPAIVPSLRFGFCDAIEEMRDEADIANEIDKARDEAYREGQQNILDEVRNGLEPLEDVSRVETLIEKIEESLAA